MLKKSTRVWLWTLSAGIYLYVSSSLILFYGPFTYAKNFFVDSIAITRHAYLLRPLSLYTLSNAEIRRHSEGWTESHGVPATTIDQSFLVKKYNSSIQIEDYSTKLWSARIMFISNPTSVKVAVTKYVGSVGESVGMMVKETGAIGGVNGGAFSDASRKGTGGIPLGTVISNGKIIQVAPKSSIIGFTKRGQLVCGTYTTNQLKSNEIVDAVTYGPIIVQNGKGVAPVDASRAARTVIGQRADGTVILIVTDGRNVHGIDNLGATYEDVQNLMLKYGAVTAANLDGGSSATMIYKNNVINSPSDILGQRKVATSFIVFP